MALRDKYSASNLNKKNNYSSFWLDNGWDNNTSIFDEDEPKKKGVDLVALASYRRAISNFVSIVTGEPDIKVTFTSAGDSYTDGKKVTISSKLDDKLFDSTVGLALHEGSHIKLSDFDFLRNLEYEIPQEYFDRSEVFGWDKYDVMTKVKDLLNYVEDRRIDYFVFTNSPGYKGYYHSLYDKYFHSKIIDKALGTDEYSSLDWDSYIFRIINLTNKNSNLDILPGLKDIRNVIFKNVKNLNSTQEAFDIAIKVFDIILNNLDVQVQNPQPQDGDGDESGEGGDSTDGNGGSGSDTISDGELDDMIENGLTAGNTSGDKKVELSDRQKKQLENAIKKQKKFMDGDITKKKLSKKDKSAMDTVESAGMSYVDVAGVHDRWSGKKIPTKVLMVKKFNKALAESNTISMISHPETRYYQDYQECINKGLVMGTILGKKLQVRGESRETKWTRLDSGRIDKRLIAELGFGNTNVFSQTFVDRYNKAYLHISVDASGSMSGSKWNKAMTSAVAMIKAADMSGTIDVVLSIRTTHSSRRGGSDVPLILVAYDSRKDKLVKVKNLFSALEVSGTTPEGLCFEAIEKDLIPGNSNQDSYFINYSDGQPYFGNSEIQYSGDRAEAHTKKMCDGMRAKGISVLSYFITDYDVSDDDYDVKAFKRMYGKDAEFIKPTNMMAVAKTMNKKFLSK